MKNLCLSLLLMFLLPTEPNTKYNKSFSRNDKTMQMEKVPKNILIKSKWNKFLTQ